MMRRVEGALAGRSHEANAGRHALGKQSVAGFGGSAATHENLHALLVPIPSVLIIWTLVMVCGGEKKAALDRSKHMRIYCSTKCELLAECAEELGSGCDTRVGTSNREAEA